MHAGFDSLLVLVVFVVLGAISNWLQRKRQGGGSEPAAPADSAPAAPRRQPRPVTPAGDSVPAEPAGWEEELRRLLGGEVVTAPPPPVVIAPKARSTPAPPRVPVAEAYEPIQTAPLHRAEERIEHALEHKVFQPLPTLQESAQTFLQASHLDDQVKEHMRQVTHHPVGLTHVLRKAVTPTAAEALALVRNPRTIRAAMVAATILGPPKSLAD